MENLFQQLAEQQQKHHQIRYLGSKLKLLPFIGNSIQTFTGLTNLKGMRIFDGFAGTAVVSNFFKGLGMEVTCNDFHFFSYCVARAYLHNDEQVPQSILDYLNNLKGDIEGFIFHNYSPSGNKEINPYQRFFFTCENAKRIDTMRLAIENLLYCGVITESQYFYLIATLVLESSRYANVSGRFQAWLKNNIKPMVYEPIMLHPLNIYPNPNNLQHRVCNGDTNKVIKELRGGDIVYIDPPYNSSTSYAFAYDQLNVIAAYNYPDIHHHLMRGTQTDDRLKTDFHAEYDKTNHKNKDFGFLYNLEKNIVASDFEYIFMSYSNESKNSKETIEQLFSDFGRTHTFELEHTAFNSNKTSSQKRTKIKEYIFCLQKK